MAVQISVPPYQPYASGVRFRFSRFANLKVYFPAESIVCLSKLKKIIEKIWGGLLREF